MKILVTNISLKTFLAKYGPNKIFGNDVDARQSMNEDELINRFDKVWNHTLKNPVITASPCDSEKARKRLSPKQLSFFNSGQEHREFRLPFNNIEFIAQLNPISPAYYELTQLWYVSSSDTHPKTLWINFDTVEERLKFRKLAEYLEYDDDTELGKEIILDFMAKFSKSLFKDPKTEID